MQQFTIREHSEWNIIPRSRSLYGWVICDTLPACWKLIYANRTCRRVGPSLYNVFLLIKRNSEMVSGNTTWFLIKITDGCVYYFPSVSSRSTFDFRDFDRPDTDDTSRGRIREIPETTTTTTIRWPSDAGWTQTKRNYKSHFDRLTRNNSRTIISYCVIIIITVRKWFRMYTVRNSVRSSMKKIMKKKNYVHPPPRKYSPL